MSKKVWLITGAGRGMGVEFVRAALASGHSVVASGRDRKRVSRVLGTSSDLLAVTLDVTNTADAEAAVRAAVDRFGRIDVLVNNAASFWQTLIVTAGCGRAQRDGGPIEEIRAGDIVWFGPGERHWHGASPTTAMTHIAISEMLDGKVVEWMERVTDEQYGR
jgi:NAD(P)-dependent dehydrogenase (short-subunit alcohol dehydrogenase family)